MVLSVHKAWSLVKHQLKDYELTLIDEYLLEELGLDTPLGYFIPTTTGPGACTFSLICYLSDVHNNFIISCRDHTNDSTWDKHKVPLPHIQQCHLLDYQSQLQSILLSHCHYSLRVGQGREVTYDLPALEKCLLDRFIHGKPTILVDIPHVSYKGDIYTVANFSAVRDKVSPQIDLDERIQMDILRELRTPDKFRMSLDVVEIVMGFLSSGGGKPKTKLYHYIKMLNMEDKPFSEKAKEHCTLGHVLSLWLTLSIGLARCIALNDQEPFQTLDRKLLEPLKESQKRDLDRALPKVDLSALLGTLYEFIETYIRHIDMNKKQWGLHETLIAHLESRELTPSKYLKELPKCITLAQVAATWKYVVEFEEHQKQ